MLNARSQNRIIDDCLERFANGATIEECLQRYPKHSEELWPILQTAIMLRQPRVKPSASANERMKAAMLVAYNENKEIEKSPVSYLSSARYTGHEHQLNKNRRRTTMNNRSIFTRFAGAAIALIFVAVAGWLVYTNMNQVSQPNGTAETAVGTSSETPTPTGATVLIAAPTPPTVEVVSGDNEETSSADVPTDQMEIDWPSPDGQWVAAADKIDSDGSRTVTLTVQDQSGTVYTPVSRTEEVTMASTEASIFGWSPNSQYLYYADTGFADGCEVLPTFYVNLSRLDVNTGATELLDSNYLADVLFSPDGTQFAFMNTYWNNNYSEDDFGNITVDIIDTLSGKTTSQIKIFDKGDIFVGGTLNNRLHWSEDGSRLVAELYDNPCPVLASEQGYQLINPEGESPLLISSANLELDSVLFAKRELTAERLLVLDAANNCEYSIDLASKRITSEGCPETNPESAMSDQGKFPNWETRRPVSEYGSWSVTQTKEDLGGDLFKVQLILVNQETDVRYTPVDEVRDSAMGGFADIVRIGWSNDGRHFYFANLLGVDGCEDLTVYSGLQRIDVTTGEVEMIVAEEMADIKFSPDLGKTITVLSRSIEAIATVFDSNTAEVLSATTFDAKYLEGGAANTVHYSSNGANIVAQLNTMWCPAVGGDIDFWSVNQSGETVKVFSSRMIPTDNQSDALLTVTGFEENVLKLTDVQDSCQFDIDINTQEVRYTSCPERLQ